MNKMIFCHTGWMDKYKGLRAGDKIKGGGSFISKHAFGWEIYNFQPFQGKMYGYVQPTRRINIYRLGASKSATKIDNILAIWTARDPYRGGVVIVGWYKDATLYRDHQPSPKGSNRKIPDGTEASFFIEAKEEKCKLLPVDARTFSIPRGKGGMGQSNVWYADKPINLVFKKQVSDFVNKGKIFKKYKTRKKITTKAWQPDPYKRQKIERIAINKVIEYYEHLGYTIYSTEKDNIGWDLTAILNDKLLRLEAKGLAQKDILIELTPNEYDKMKRYQDSYRICIVTNTLTKHSLLRIFSFSLENRRWEDEKGTYLEIDEIVSARMAA